MGNRTVWVVVLLLGLGGCRTTGSPLSAWTGLGRDQALAKQVENDPFPSAHQVHLAEQ